MILETRALKVSLALEPEAVAGITVPNGLPKFTLRIRVGGRRTVTADVNAKSLRRCIATIQAAEPGGIAVVLQGKLEGDEIAEAGIVAQAKTPKPAADAA